MANSFNMVLFIALIFTPIVHQTSAECPDYMINLSKNCMEFVKNNANPKVAPSKECCAVVQNSNVESVCGELTKDVKKLVSMEKVVYVAQACGRPLAEGSICGNFEVPKSSK